MVEHLSATALEESRRFHVRPIPMLRPLAWLAKGWIDLWCCPLPSLLHGLIMALGGLLITWLAYPRYWWLAGAFSGFLLVAPILATGLYQISRNLDRGEPAHFGTVLSAWHPTDSRLVRFGLLLFLAGTGWVLTSSALIFTFGGGQVHTPAEFMKHVVLNDNSLLFEGWLVLGGLLAAPIFASSVVAIPMLIDRPVTVLAAVFTSWRVVMTHPWPCAFWAFLLMGITTVGMLPAFLGLIVIVPWLGHASWHAYRDLVTTRQPDLGN